MPPKKDNDPPAEVPLNMPSALNLTVEALEAAEGFQPVPAGSYAVEINEVLLKLSKAGAPMLVVQCTPQDNEFPMAGRVRDFLVLPTQGLDSQQAEMRNFGLKEFAQSLNIGASDLVETIQLAFNAFMEPEPPESVVLEDLTGLPAAAMLTLEPEGEYDSGEGVMKLSPEQNKVAKWIVGA